MDTNANTSLATRSTNVIRDIAHDPGVQHAAAGAVVAVIVAAVKSAIFPRA